MKKFITMSIAAGALALGSAAHAQDLGSAILGLFGVPTYSYNYGYSYPQAQAQVYRDSYGRTFYYDQYGRQVYLQTTPPASVAYDAWGRPVYGGSSYYSYGYGYNAWDRDGDGVSNQYDRWPDDRRYR